MLKRFKISRCVTTITEIDEDVCSATGSICFHEQRTKDKRRSTNIFSSPIGSSRFNENVANSSQPLPIHSSHDLLSQRLQKDERDLDADEESWFNDDADENKISTNNNANGLNGSSDDEDSQTELTETTNNSSAISNIEPIRSHHSLAENDDDAFQISSTDSSFSMISSMTKTNIDKMSLSFF